MGSVDQKGKRSGSGAATRGSVAEKQPVVTRVQIDLVTMVLMSEPFIDNLLSLVLPLPRPGPYALANAGSPKLVVPVLVGRKPRGAQGLGAPCGPATYM